MMLAGHSCGLPVSLGQIRIIRGGVIVAGERMYPNRPVPLPMRTSGAGGARNGLRAAHVEVEKQLIMVHRELEHVRRLRVEAEQYQKATVAKANREAQMLILNTRQAMKREIAALRQRVSAEVEQLVADIQTLRIAAEHELTAQRKFTDAAKIRAISGSFPDEPVEETEVAETTEEIEVMEMAEEEIVVV